MKQNWFSSKAGIIAVGGVIGGAGDFASVSGRMKKPYKMRHHQWLLLNLFARYRAIPDNTVREMTIMLAFDQSPLPALV